MFLRSVRLQRYKPICPRFMLLYPKDVCHGSRSSSFPFFYFSKQKEEQKEKLLLPRRRRAEEWKEKSRVAAAAVCKQINRKRNRLQRAGELLHRRARTHSHTHTHTHTDTHTHTRERAHTHTHHQRLKTLKMMHVLSQMRQQVASWQSSTSLSQKLENPEWFIFFFGASFL